MRSVYSYAQNGFRRAASQAQQLQAGSCWKSFVKLERLQSIADARFMAGLPAGIAGGPTLH